MKNPIKNVPLWDVIWEFAVIGFFKKRKKKERSTLLNWQSLKHHHASTDTENCHAWQGKNSA